MQPFIVVLVTWFYSGLSPKAPGTAGSLAALPFAYVIHAYAGGQYLLLAAIAMFFVGWWATRQYLRAHPEKSDPKEVVVDEVAAQWLLLSVMLPTWQSYLVGFALFRLFDALKPWPVSWFDKNIKGAFGVMLDDIIAALIPMIVWMLIWFRPWFEPVLLWMQGR